MATVQRTIRCPIEKVFCALIEPETYPHWLIGARDVRAVDDQWPAIGTAFHHRVGLIGPLKVADNTKVLDIDNPRRLSLEVRARPFGRGRATFTLSEQPGAEGAKTIVKLDEVPIGLLAPTRPLVDPLTAHRNRQSLANLAKYVEDGESRRAPG